MRVLGADTSYLQASDALLIYLRRKVREDNHHIPYAKHDLEGSTGECKSTTEMRLNKCLCKITEGAVSHPSVKVNETVTSGSERT